MPKVEIDYSNTVFYKICCKDPSINDVYIGHTTNFIQRKYAHKQGCLNIKSQNYNCKLYNVIRDNNGWDNWRMEIIAFHDCDGLMTAKKYEQVYFEQYKATLNSIEPMPKPKPKIIKETKKEKQLFYCSVCNVHFTTNKLHEIHNETKKHEKNAKKLPATVNLAINSAKIYNCEQCDYSCVKRSDYTKHLTTLKHKKSYDGVTIDDNCTQKVAGYECKCGNTYMYRQGLYKHKTTCSVIQGTNNKDNNPNEFQLDKELLIKMLLKNQDVMEKLAELIPIIMANIPINDPSKT
jgi:hypothetical protein